MKPFNVRGTKYRFVVMKVLTRDHFGRPRTMETLYDEESTAVIDGDHFLIVAMQEDVAKPTHGGTA